MTESQRQPAPRDDDGELATALAFLDFARESVLKKTLGVTAADLRRAVVPTGTSLLWLVHHLADSERYWFQVHLLGRGAEPEWEAPVPEPLDADEVIEGYRSAISASNEAIREIGDPTALAVRPVDGTRLSLRWTIAHMTSETARHAGHADIARELIDGVTGR